MKRFLSIAFLFISVVTSAQAWVWGQQGVGTPGSDDEGISVAMDRSGNIYETGDFYGNLTFGSTILSANKAACFYLVKYDSSGNILWARQSINDGSSIANATWVTTDSLGYVYVTGRFSDTITIGAYTMFATTGYKNVFLVKYDKNGNVIWARQSVGQDAVGMSVVCNATGKVYITGDYQSNITFGTRSLTGGFQSIFLVEYDSAGNAIWAQQPNSYSNANSVYGACLDLFGNIYLAGSFSTKTGFGSSVLNSSGTDAFIAKYDSGGNALWAQQSVNGNAQGNNVTCDATGNVYFTGSFNNQHATFGSITLSAPSTGTYLFLTKYTPSGNVTWSQTANYLDNYSWVGWGLGTDSLKCVYLAAGSIITVQGNHTLAFGADTLSVNNAFDAAVLMKFDSLGNPICGSIIASGGDDEIGLVVDKAGKYVIWGSDLFETLVAFGADTLGTTGGDEWPFVARWNGCCGKVHLAVNDTDICMGSSVLLSATGGINYVWSTGATTSSINVSPASDTTYIVNSGKLSCVSNATASVTVTPVPVPSVSNTQYICEGMSAILNASGGTYYAWTPATGLNATSVFNPAAMPKVTTTYTVTVSNGKCMATDSVTVVVNPLPAGTVCCDSVILSGQAVQLISSGGGSYEWFPPTGLNCTNCPNPVATPNVTTTYTLTVTNDSGCAVSYLVTIDVECSNIFIPDAFSPNGDGQNDILYVRGDCIKTMEFVVFDRWGNKIFESNSTNIGWDGTYKGEAMNTGSFAYYLNAQLFDGTTYEKKGNVALVR